MTTLTELKAINAAAPEGLRTKPRLGNKTPAAKGMPTVLYAKAQNKFWRILLKVARLS
ncbi:hypothetical protein [Nostoc sphaeroides]|uniref:hypothetical protein n=1 Tax=Nostoc sphaeroides TaxID=446679 RepID=UPI003977939B